MSIRIPICENGTIIAIISATVIQGFVSFVEKPGIGTFNSLYSFNLHLPGRSIHLETATADMSEYDDTMNEYHPVWTVERRRYQVEENKIETG